MFVIMYWGFGWVGLAVLVVVFFRGTVRRPPHASAIAEVTDDGPLV